MRRCCRPCAAPDTVFVRPIRLLKTTTFRLAMVYLALFGISVFLLLGFVYWSTAGIANSQTDDTIQAEITGLAEQYRANGLTGLVKVVRERAEHQRQSLYLIVDSNNTALAGNLNAWPRVDTQEGGWLEFYYSRPVGGKIRDHLARARHLLLGGGFELLVGRDVQERLRIEQVMRTSLVWAVLLTLGLGLAGGIFMSRNLLRRIETINVTSREIMAGDLHQRIPVSGSEDEMDQLAGNLNDMLEQIEKLVTGMSQVTENIAHDLRNPLNRLRNRLEVTLMGEGSIEDYRGALEQTIGETEQLLETFNGLLNIARAESGRPDGEMVDFDLSDLVRDMADLYRPVAEEKEIKFSENICADVTLCGNRHLMSQALANLLDNGVKYTPGGGTVAVVLERDDAGLRLIIADSGPGIPDADRERVLDRFVRLEDSRNSPGSGLGLSLVKAVAGLHSADIMLEDNLPGLRVVLSFPKEGKV